MRAQIHSLHTHDGASITHVSGGSLANRFLCKWQSWCCASQASQAVHCWRWWEHLERCWMSTACDVALGGACCDTSPAHVIAPGLSHLANSITRLDSSGCGRWGIRMSSWDDRRQAPPSAATRGNLIGHGRCTGSLKLVMPHFCFALRVADRYCPALHILSWFVSSNVLVVGACFRVRTGNGATKCCANQ